MSTVTYTTAYICLQTNASGGCDAWQQVNQGDYITPELVGQMILFVFLLFVLVYGIKSIRKVM